MTDKEYQNLVNHCHDVMRTGCSESPEKYSIGCPKHYGNYTIQCPFYHRALLMSPDGDKCLLTVASDLAKRWLTKMTVIREIMK